MRWTKKKEKRRKTIETSEIQKMKWKKMTCDREGGWTILNIQMCMNEVEKWRWHHTNERTNRQTKRKKEKKKDADREMVYQNEETVWWRREWAKMNEHIVISKKMSFIFGLHDARHTPKTTKWWRSDCLCGTSFSVTVASGPIRSFFFPGDPIRLFWIMH